MPNLVPPAPTVPVPPTPGPWTPWENGDADSYLLLGPNDRWVISFRQNGELSLPQQRANMRLISAAPDLLVALLLVLPDVEASSFGGPDVVARIDRARAAIGKAVGLGPQRNFRGIGELERTGYIPAGSADEREGR